MYGKSGITLLTMEEPSTGTDPQLHHRQLCQEEAVLPLLNGNLYCTFDYISLNASL